MSNVVKSQIMTQAHTKNTNYNLTEIFVVINKDKTLFLIKSSMN